MFRLCGKLNEDRIKNLNKLRTYYKSLADSEVSNEGLSRPSSSSKRKKFGEGVFDDNGRLINRD